MCPVECFSVLQGKAVLCYRQILPHGYQGVEQLNLVQLAKPERKVIDPVGHGPDVQPPSAYQHQPEQPDSLAGCSLEIDSLAIGPVQHHSRVIALMRRQIPVIEPERHCSLATVPVEHCSPETALGPRYNLVRKPVLDCNPEPQLVRRCIHLDLLAEHYQAKRLGLD